MESLDKKIIQNLYKVLTTQLYIIIDKQLCEIVALLVGYNVCKK